MCSRMLLRAIVVLSSLLPAAVQAGAIFVPGKLSDGKFIADKETKGPCHAVSYCGLTANVDTRSARVKIEEAIIGPSPAVDAVCIIPLPEGAESPELTTTRNVAGGERAESLHPQYLAAAEAQKLYDAIAQATASGKILGFSGRPALIVPEFLLKNKFKLTTEYRQPIVQHGELCRLECPMPAHGFATRPVDRLSAKVTIMADAPLRAIFCPTHTTTVDRTGLQKAIIRVKCDAYSGNEDLRLLWVADQDELGLRVLACRPDADEDGYFMLVGNPTGSAAPRRAAEKDVVFVLDSSGSMRGEKIEQARSAIDYCLGQLNSDDRFNIITFGTEVASFRDGPVARSAAALAAARDFVDTVVAKGETNIDGALAKALAVEGPPATDPVAGATGAVRPRPETSDANTSRPRIVIFLTDGTPTVGELVPETIVANAKRVNISKARIFVMGLGHDVNAHLLDRLAEVTNGSSEYVVPGEEIDVKVASLYDRLAHPVLTNCELTFGDLRTNSVYPQKLPTLFRGSEVMVFGRYRNGGKHTFRIAGREQGQPVEWACTADLPDKTASNENDFVAPLWAARKIGFLLQEIRLHGANDELIGEVVRLSKRFGIVTEYTAFIAAAGKDFSKADALGMARAQIVTANGLQAGQWAVNQARNDMQLQRRAVASQLGNGYFDRRGNVVNVENVQQVGRRAYYLRDGQWVDGEDPGKRKTRAVTLNGREYQDLVRGNRDFARAQQLGWAVEMNVGDERIVVEKNGKQKDEELRRTVQPLPAQNMQNSLGPNQMQQFRNQAPQNNLQQVIPQQ
jgi:Ca-activated chloride channel homolog